LKKTWPVAASFEDGGRLLEVKVSWSWDSLSCQLAKQTLAFNSKELNSVNNLNEQEILL
jgi:hypothetical protein